MQFSIYADFYCDICLNLNICDLYICKGYFTEEEVCFSLGLIEGAYLECLHSVLQRLD